MWFTENDSGKVGAITLKGKLLIKFDTGDGSYPFGITAGPDGRMWFCLGFGNAIGRVNLP
jgi:virginiamycin B lyase